MSNFRKIAYTIVSLIITFLFVVVIAEGSLRLYSKKIEYFSPTYFGIQFHPYYRLSSIPGLVYEMCPNVVMPEGTETNSLGFRDREYIIPKPKNIFRIVGLGDSICYGPGVKLESTFLKQLEGSLNRDCIDGNVKYEVINCGVSGYNLVQYYLTLKRKAIKYDPDLVIFSIWVDDESPPYAPLAVPPFVGKNSFMKRTNNFLLKNSYLWKFLYYRLFLARFYNDGYKKVNIHDTLQKIIELIENNNIKLLFVFQSTLSSDFDNNVEFYKLIKSMLIGKHIPWIDMHPIYLKYLGKRDIGTLGIGPDDPHLNEEGHRIIALALAECLTKYYIKN